jgi:pimeloyl-ACP methyl ester carboxylesterase
MDKDQVPLPRRRILKMSAAAAAAGVVSASTGTAVAASPTGGQKSSPTVVLVHGAFADASSWNGVTERLQRRAPTARSPRSAVPPMSA